MSEVQVDELKYNTVGTSNVALGAFWCHWCFCNFQELWGNFMSTDYSVLWKSFLVMINRETEIKYTIHLNMLYFTSLIAIRSQFDISLSFGNST